MRNELNGAEFSALAAGRCPDCGGTEFRGGPRGGLAQNIECERCKARFNITRHVRELVFAQRIEREDEGGSIWPLDTEPPHVGLTSAERTAQNITLQITALSQEIGRRVAATGGRPEDWLSEAFVSRVVEEHARAVLVEWLVG